MRRVTRQTLILTGIGILVFSTLSFAQEGPTAQVKATINRVLDILRDPALKAPEKEEVRRTQLRAVIFTRFDFAEMARRSLGIHWRKRTPKERKEFVDLFADLLERSYHKKLESYTDQEILYTKEQADKRYGVVRTKIVSEKEHIDIPIDYKVIRRTGQWKVYDVVVEGVSLVSNYRTQFNRIIQTSSYANLLRKMRVKQEAEALSTVPTRKR
ncbi:MAG: phospholipid-binding protein MlaC [Candidatus Methylomirabilales bacterium]